MTKSQLIKALDEYPDDTPLTVGIMFMSHGFGFGRICNLDEVIDNREDVLLGGTIVVEPNTESVPTA